MAAAAGRIRQRCSPLRAACLPHTPPPPADTLPALGTWPTAPHGVHTPEMHAARLWQSLSSLQEPEMTRPASLACLSRPLPGMRDAARGRRQGGSWMRHGRRAQLTGPHGQ